jgi:hypothetical protein
MQVKLNREQCVALSVLLDPTEPLEGEAMTYPVEVRVVYGTKQRPWQLVVNGCYLHTDGEWATFPEGQPQHA